MNLDILVILDRSGSMQSARADHEGGLRSFVEEQKQLDGDVRFTLVQFDDHDPCEIVFDRAPIRAVRNISLIPRGSTPLLDAVGLAVSHLRAKVPSDANVVVMVITDGQENASHEWTKSRVRQLVTELEAKNWSFLFLGANVDAFAEGGGLGIPMAGTMGYAQASPGATVSIYNSTTQNITRARRQMVATAQRLGAVKGSTLSYTTDQRDAAMGFDNDTDTFKTTTTVATTDESDQ
jgi:Mg-chelatase subunit ChlD